MPAWLGDNLVTVVDGVAFGMLLFTIAVGLSLVFGIMDVLNLARGALYLTGAYLAVRFVGNGQATLGAFVLAGLAAVAVGAGAGAGLALLTRPLATRGHLDQALLTLGVALVVGDLLSARFGNDVQSVPPPQFLAGSVAIGGREYPSYRLAVIAAGLAMAVVVYLLVERTRAGALVRATVADAPMVRALGVDTGRLMVATFAAGVVLACLGGASRSSWSSRTCAPPSPSPTTSPSWPRARSSTAPPPPSFAATPPWPPASSGSRDGARLRLATWGPCGWRRRGGWSRR